MHLDFSHLADPPIWAVPLPQPRLERLLGEHARELGAGIRRGHEVARVSQDDATVAADVRGPDGPYRVTARYLVGCDGAHSRVRDTAGIPFPGTTYPEVNRLGQVTVPDSVTRLGNGDLDVPGLGRIRPGFTRTDRGVFALRVSSPPGVCCIQTTEDEPAEVDDDAPMTLTEFQDSIRRVLGADLPLGEVTRLSRYGFQARQAERYRDGRILLAGDAAHQFPATGIGINVGMLDAVNLAWKLAAAIGGWAPAGLLDTYHDERHFAGARALLQTQAQVALRRGQDPAAQALRELFLELLADEQPLRRIGALIAGTDIRYPMPGPGQHALAGTFAPDLTLHTGQGTTSVAELMHPARPVLLDLADRPDLRETARDWQHRIDIHTAQNRSAASRRPADPPGRPHRLGRNHRRARPTPPRPRCEKRSPAGSGHRGDCAAFSQRCPGQDRRADAVGATAASPRTPGRKSRWHRPSTTPAGHRRRQGRRSCRPRCRPADGPVARRCHRIGNIGRG